MIHIAGNDSKKLTQSVLQVTDLLGMYQAELARILGLHCSDIGAMASAKKFIENNSNAWHQAWLLVRFYNGLYEKFSGDEALMCHWLRRHHPGLSASPFYLMVDHGQLDEVVQYLEADSK